MSPEKEPKHDNKRSVLVTHLVGGKYLLAYVENMLL